MEKAKTGDQRFKRPAWIPCAVVAGLTVLLFIVLLVVMVAALFNFKGRQNDALNTRLPDSQTEFAPFIQQLWFKPNRLPVDVAIEPAHRVVAQGDKICVMLKSGKNDQTPASDPVSMTILVDFKAYPSSDYINIPRDEFYCIRPDLEKGYHLITMRTQSDSYYEWAVRVE